MATQLLEKEALPTRTEESFDDTQMLGVKTCPRCGQRLFEDMQVCYECLYDFDAPDGEDESREEPKVEEEDSIYERLGALGDDDLSDGYLECLSLTDEDLVDKDESYPMTEQRTLMVSVPEGKEALCCDTLHLGFYLQTGDVNLFVPLPKRGLTVGRLPTNDVVLHSRAVSRRHVMLTPLGATAHVEDMGATNPAILEGREVSGGEEMQLGETLDICGSLMTLVGWMDDDA